MKKLIFGFATSSFILLLCGNILAEVVVYDNGKDADTEAYFGDRGPIILSVKTDKEEYNIGCFAGFVRVVQHLRPTILMYMKPAHI
jgi:hypothetical protein